MNQLDTQTTQRPLFILVLILMAYLFNGSLFARLTPAWQSPDEPAHYNYIAHVAHGKGLPTLQMGDFDMDYINRIVGSRFAPELSVESLRYEFYQPPLYYLSTVPVYWLGRGMSDGTEGTTYGQALIAVRFYGLLLGLVSLILIYSCLQVAFPLRPLIALGATAFAATLPMHVAMTASVNNDSLAILLLLAASLALLRWMRAALAELPCPTGISPVSTSAQTDDSRSVDTGQSFATGQSFDTGQDETAPSNLYLTQKGPLLVIGMLLGFGLLTKIYAYAFLPVCLSMVVLISWRRVNVRQAVVNGFWMLVPALLLGMSLWIRNISLYGILDPLGLTWHDAVVIGQPTTVEWIAQNGWPAYWERAIGFTFRSFWGVFGWLGVFWDWRLYTLVRILTIAVAAGFVGLLFSALPGRRFSPESASESEIKAANGVGSSFYAWVALFLGLTFAMVLISYGFYNLKFVQHQGRYFFWGLLPISAAFALGWRQLMHPRTMLFAILILLGLLVYTIGMGERNLWLILIHLAMIMLLLLHLLLSLASTNDTIVSDNNGSAGEDDDFAHDTGGDSAPIHQLRQSILRSKPLRRIALTAQPFVWAAPFVLLFLLCIISVFGYVVPQLSLTL